MFPTLPVLMALSWVPAVNTTQAPGADPSRAEDRAVRSGDGHDQVSDHRRSDSVLLLSGEEVVR